MEREMASRTPTILDLTAELAKLTMFRGLTPQTTRTERQGSRVLAMAEEEGRRRGCTRIALIPFIPS